MILMTESSNGHGWLPSKGRERKNPLSRIMVILMFFVLGSIGFAPVATGADETRPPCSRAPVSVPVGMRVAGPDLTPGDYVAWMNWNGKWYASASKYLREGWIYTVVGYATEVDLLRGVSFVFAGQWEDGTASIAKTEFWNDAQSQDNVMMVICEKETISPNQPPTVTLTYSPENPAPGETIIISASASDPDGDPLTYKWFLNDKLREELTQSNARFSNPPAGTYTFLVVVDDGRGGAAQASVFIKVQDSNIVIDLNIPDGQPYTQGDDFPVQARITRSGQPVPGATVNLKVTSPKGGSPASHAKLVTDEHGQAEWTYYFTVCSSAGTWQVAAEADDSGDNATLTRNITLQPLSVSSAQVTENMNAIIDLWKTSKEVPNGIDQPFIDRLWWPKGFKVNMRWYLDSRMEPYTCSSLATNTLKFLNNIRFSENKERRLMMAGVDYGPVNDGTGLVHVAVALYPKGKNWWIAGYVLEPWFNQIKEAWWAILWCREFFGGDTPSNNFLWGNLWANEYPITGSDGGYYPEMAGTVPPSLESRNRTRVLTYSPAVTMITDELGRRAGRLPDGTIINEIPDAQQSHAAYEDGTFINMIYAPNGQYQVSITGVGNGAFHLETGTDKEIMIYGEQPILKGERATFTLQSAAMNQPLTLANGTIVQPKPELIEENRSDEKENDGDSGGGGGCFMDALIRYQK